MARKKSKRKWKPREPKPIHPNTALLSISQAAVVLNCSENTFRRMVDAKTLPSIVLRSSGNKRLIRVSKRAIEDWLAKEERRRP
jgi:excisionase family DNA binding protein